MIAALYVSEHGPYVNRADVDAWTIDRDATRYAGPWPVVAHPPCGHWGNYAHMAHDDGHTGPIAVEQVRRWGGVLEHPKNSRLWPHCGMPRPGEFADEFGGRTIVVNQHDWGHSAKKRTWLYIVGVRDLPAFPAPLVPPESHVVSYRGGRKRKGALEFLSKRRRQLTPSAFADWLIEIASRCAK